MASLADGVQDRTVSVGRVFGLGFNTIAHNPVGTIGIALLFGSLPSTLLQVGVREYLPDIVASVGFLGTAVAGLITFVVIMAFALITQGALLRATMAESEGKQASFGELIATGLGVALPLLGLAIVSSFGIMIGFILLFIPGVILYLMWSVAAPAVVAEKLGVFAALGRSRQLTSGARWKILGIQLIILVLYWILAVVVGLAAGTAAMSTDYADPTHVGAGLVITMVLLGTALTVVWGTVQAALFLELRNWKEGPRTEALAEVFA
jgi:hypothetical protein